MKKVTLLALLALLYLNIFGNETYIKNTESTISNSIAAYNADSDPVGAVLGTLDVSETGAAIYSIPIDIPQGIGGMQPSVAIAYNSQAGNGIAGWGTNLSGFSVITRGPKTIYFDKIAKGLTYDANDAYYLDGQRLIHDPQNNVSSGSHNARYCLESDPLTQVTLLIESGNTYFRVQTAGGMTFYYGKTTSGKHSYQDSGKTKINSWHLDYVEDALGNYTDYKYKNYDNVIYPDSIIYGKNKKKATSLSNTIAFKYESRNDKTAVVFDGIKRGDISRRLLTVTSATNGTIYREYGLTYDLTIDQSGTKFSRLTKVSVKNSAGEVLKPLNLKWTGLPYSYHSMKTPSFANVAGTPSFSDQYFIGGDFNDDGLTDVAGIYYDATKQRQYAYVYYAKKNSGNITFIDSGKKFDIGSDVIDLKGNVLAYNASNMVADVNNDGIKELLVPHFDKSSKSIGLKVSFLDKNVVSEFSCSNKMISSEIPLFDIGDLNNDGKVEYICLDKGATNNKYQGAIIQIKEDGYYSNQVFFNLGLAAKPEKMFINDYDFDGLPDMLVFYKGGYSIYWNQGNGLTTTTYSDSKKTSGTNIGNVKTIYPGDFNGDGMLDFVMNDTDDKNWYFALNTGKGNFTKTLAGTIDLYDQSFTGKDEDKFHCHVYDFDFDGKSDIIITKAMYTFHSDISGAWGEFAKTHTYWMLSTGSTLKQVFTPANSNREGDAYSFLYVQGDFNGDGQPDLINYGYNCYNSTNTNATPIWRMYEHTSYNPACGKVSSIIDGFENQTNIKYASFADPSSYVYAKGSDTQAYPVINLMAPLHGVKEVATSDGLGGFVTTVYKFQGLKAHIAGKGMMGMSSKTVTKSTLGITTETGVSNWDTDFYAPSSIYTKETIEGKTAKSETSLRVVLRGSDTQVKKYFTHPLQRVDTDIHGNVVTTTYNYLAYETNEKWYLKEENVAFGKDNMYKKTTYDNHVLVGSVIKEYRPQTVTVKQKHMDSSSEFVQVTKYKYNATTGLQTELVENAGTSSPLTTFYTYDEVGNLLTEKVQSSNSTEAPPITTTYVYDANNRFVTKTYTSPATTTRTFTYNIWGDLLTEKDETYSTTDPLITSHTYDGWRNRTLTTHPDKRTTTTQRVWNNYYIRHYYILSQTTGEPWVKTYYDRLGRVTMEETVGPNGMSIVNETTFNNKGNAIKKTNKTGDITVTEDYTYDNFGRVKTFTSSSGSSVSYAYGNRQTTTTTNGKVYKKTFDAWGNVKTVTDPVSSISYTYHSSGNPLSITTGGSTVSMTYDDAGRQTTLKDPNTGTITYSYDAVGRIKKQTDSNTKVTENKYDNLGRTISTTIAGVATTYTYGTSKTKFDFNRLTSVRTGKDSIAYTYDKYGRTLTEKRQIDGYGALQFTYKYNTKGQVENITYPGSLVVNQQYDDNGNVIKVLAGTQTIWELASATGRFTTTKLGGTLTATRTLTPQGFLSNLKTVKGTTVLHNMDFIFDKATGNLTSRTGMIDEIELFGYDDMDRLTIVKQGPTAKTKMNIEYASNGNIKSKTGLGLYGYGGTPHAVTSVENTNGLLPPKNQIINYTAFNKVSYIKDELDDNNSDELSFTYGPDRQRWKTVLKKNGKVTKTTIFADDYEVITENGVAKQLYYISGGDGVAAIYVKQSGQADKIYYPHVDHLGSIVKLTDGNGTEVFKASYDAWGNQKISNNTFAFHRGYTGHEHLKEFKLINMNGRMYDPVVGRFLSPDPYVQMPDLSQNFNRFSYCLNNPLKYTDPTGELFGIDDLFLIAAFVYIGGVHSNMQYAAANQSSPFNPANWNWKSSHTYIAMVNAAAFASGGIPYPQVPGMIPNGLLQAGTQTVINGVNNLIDKRDFFDDWYIPAGMGFVSGARAGYGLAQQRGANYWWGDEVKVNRTQWSFNNVAKYDYAIETGMPNVGSKSANDCVPTSFAEAEARLGGNRDYEYFKGVKGYKEGTGHIGSSEDMSKLVRAQFQNSVELDAADSHKIFDPSFMQEVANRSEVITVHFQGHMDNVRRLEVFINAPQLNRVVFRNSKYNRRRGHGWEGILSIFHIR